MADSKAVLELSPAEQETIERMRMTTEERIADLEKRRDEAIQSSQSQAVARDLSQMHPRQRRAHIGAFRLASAIAALKRDSESGLPVADALAELKDERGDDCQWLIGELSREAR